MRSVVTALMLIGMWGGEEGVSGQSGLDDGGLAAIRAALGGSTALDGVRTLRLEGESTRIVGPLRLASQVTLTVVRPDRYLRVDTMAIAGRPAEATVGFVGATVVQSARGQDGVRVDPAALIPVAARDEALRAGAQEQRRDLRRLLLGYLAAPFDAPTMAVTAGGIAEAPDGRADINRLTFEDASEVMLFSDTRTHLPLMVTWQGPDFLVRLKALGNRTDQRAGTPALPLTAGVSHPIEHRLYFSDFRPVGAVRWPFVIRRAAAGELMEEVRFERIVINPPVDLAVFDGRR